MTVTFRILFVGNSYTTRNDMPLLLQKMAAELGLRIEVRVIAFGGASLAAHWNRGEVQQVLAQEKWNAVVLQDQSTRPIRAMKSMQEHVRLLVAAIHDADSRPFLYMTWARKSAPESQGVITSACEGLAAETGASLVPVGLVWEELRKLNPQLDLYDPDLSHPSFAGSYAAACVFLVSLFDKMPKPVIMLGTNLHDSDINLIHKMAWQVVRGNITCCSNGRPALGEPELYREVSNLGDMTLHSTKKL